ncbi:transferase [Aeromicrobium flavum]|uniref:Transferase n=1 Tax=Aeromicrobium flavum TaxID=416568 RepID=A0A512HSQ7_9ACTN|nr:acyltransferase [Aeromicrobium flavum]GEO88486.1 transferase [Aeromicrobium flavum]
MSLVRRVLRQFREPLRDGILNVFIGSSFIPRALRPRLLRLAGHDVHPKAIVFAGVFIGGWRGLTLGEGAGVSYRTFLDLTAPITIEPGAGVSFNCTLITSSHAISDSTRRWGDLQGSPIVIGAGAWIGANCTVMPGVTIAPGTVVGAGSLVTKSLETPGVYAGVPARFIRPLD